MATGGDALVTLPDGQTEYGPIDPRTWAAKERARARLLTRDVAGAIAWHRNRPFFQGLQTISQSITASTWTPITLDWEMIDAWGGHSGTSDLWYPPYTASNGTDYYLVTGYVPMSGADATKVGIAGIIKNGAEIHEGSKFSLVGGHSIDPMIIDLIGVTGGDTLSLATWTNLAAGAPTVVSGKTPSLTARWVGSAAGTVSPLPPVPHSWIPADYPSASAAGVSSKLGGVAVPLNSEVRDLIRFLNYPPLARLTSQASTQTIPTGGVWTPVQFPTAGIDTYTGWSSGTNTKYTVQRAGVYLSAGFVSLVEVSAAGGWRGARLLVTAAGTGTTTPYGGTTVVPLSTGTTGTAMYAARHLRLAAGDTVEVQAANGGSSALSVNASTAAGSRLIMVWKGR